MAFSVEFQKSAAKEASRLPRMVQLDIRAALETLALDPFRATNVKKLQGRDGYRLRVGDYRIVYLVDGAKLIVLVIRVAHRREAYR